MDQDGIYTKYVPFSTGKRHKGKLQETVTLSYATPKIPAYVLKFRKLKKTLSSAQLDCVTLALESHQHHLANGERQGFFIGDGAGVGKGRELAGIIAENFYLGFEKAVWFTCSEALLSSCERDLRDVHGGKLDIPIFTFGAKYDKPLPSRGVLFCLYTTLTATNKKTSRFDAITKWLGEDFEGVIVMDECHRAKSCETAEGKISKIGNHVVEIQKVHKKAKVVYSSATGVSEVAHMCYMRRLGLFGDNCSFEDAHDFTAAMKSSGVSCMELLGVQMKSSGLFLSRILAMNDIKFDVLKCEDYSRRFYNKSALLWAKLLMLTKSKQMDRISMLNALSHYWGAHQRFYTVLMISSKVKAAVKIAKDHTSGSNEHAVVIGLQNTGESQQPSERSHSDEHCFSSARVILQRAAATCCELVLEDLEYLRPSEDESVYDEQLDFKDNWTSDETNLEKEIEELFKDLYSQFPPNPLDYLIDQLGGHAKVAELTGRTGGYIRDGSGNFKFSKLRLDRNAEIINFQSGRKDIVVVTDAGSVGISLHDEVESSNPATYSAKHRKRIHVTMQCPWSAVKMVQQLGRTHRSRAMSLPDHIFLLSDISAESRLMAAISERIQSMGALTQADRKAGFSAYFLSEIHGKYGKKAIKKVCAKLWKSKDTRQCKRALQFVGVMDSNGIKNGKGEPTIFLNRLMGCPIFVQKKLLHEIESKLDSIIEIEKKDGKYDDGIKAFEYGVVTRATIVSEENFFTREGNSVALKEIKINRTMSWADVRAILSANDDKEPFQFYLRDGGSKSNRVLLGFPLKDGDTMVYQPNNCEQTVFDVEQMYGFETCTVEVAKPCWRKQYKWMCSGTCIHSYESEDSCIVNDCQKGKAVFSLNVLCGSVISVWPELTKLMDMSKSRPQAAKVLLTNGTKLIGLLVPNIKLASLRTIFSGQDEVETGSSSKKMKFV